MLSLPRVTEMFQFTRFPLRPYLIQAGVTGHDPSRVSPFGDPRIKAWSTAPRGLSQPPTSFIGIWRQGIHRWLFVAWEFSLHCSLRKVLLLARLARCSCSLLSSQRTGSRPAAPRRAARASGSGGEAACGLETAAPRTQAREATPSQRNSDAGAAPHASRWCPDGPVPVPEQARDEALADPGVGSATIVTTDQ